MIPESVAYHIGSIPPIVLMTALVWIFIVVLSLGAAREIRSVPGGLQNVCEILLESVKTMADEAIGPEAPRFYPLLCGLFIFILVSNMVGLIPGLISPTSDLNTTIALSIIVFVYYNALGIRRHGWHYFLHFFGPPLPWFMAPLRLLIFLIEIISQVARPFSLALRLFCNIFSKEMLLGILAFLLVKFYAGPTFIERSLQAAPLLLRPAIELLGVLVGLVQALIFLLLTISYIAGAIQAEEHES